jgi:hypothetical protein
VGRAGAPGQILSFYPYRIGKEWWAIYGSNSVLDHVDAGGTVNPNAKNIFYSEMAKAEAGLTSKWIRQTHLNPLPINPEFIEKSVVTQVAPDLYINVYDGAKKDEIAYACPRDGIHWEKEQVIKIEAASNWIRNTRTPLCLIEEGRGLYTIYFTAFDGNNPNKVEPLWHNGFGNIGKLQVRLKVL